MVAISGGDGSIILTTQIDQTGLKRGMASMKSRVSSLSKSFAKIGAAIGVAFGVDVLIRFGKQAVQLASDLQEVQNVVDVAFGQMAYKIEQFSKTAIENFGISELTAKRTASTYMAMAKGMGVAEEAGSDMAIVLTGLTADMASFYNVSQDVADTAIKSIFTGETESLKKFGIVMTEVNLQQYAMSQGINKSINSMTQLEKTMLRYNYILQQTALAQGDFARTQSSWANQIRILSERWKELQSSFGEAIITIGSLVLPLINAVLEGLSKIAQASSVVAKWIYKIFTGEDLKTDNVMAAVSKNTNLATQEMESFGDAVESAGKKAEKALAPFDTLQIISASEPTVGGLSGSIDFIADSVDSLGNVSQEAERFSFLKEKLEELRSAFERMSEIDFSSLSEGLAKILQPLIELANIAWEILLWGIENVIVPLTEIVVEKALPQFFESLSQALRLFKTILDKGFKIFQKFYNDFLRPIAEYTADAFVEMWENLNKNIEEFITEVESSSVWEDLQIILSAIGELLEPIVKAVIDFIEWQGKLGVNVAWQTLKVLFQDIADVLGIIAALITGDFDDAWQHLNNIFAENRIEQVKTGVDALKKSFEQMGKSLKDTATEMFTTWADNISDWWTNDVEPWFTKEKWEEQFFNVGESLAEFFISEDGYVQTWKDGIEKWWTDNVSPWFTKEKWDSVFTTITDSVEDFFSAEDGFVKTWSTKISEWWTNDVTPWFTAEKWQELGEKIKTGLENGFNGAISSIGGLINSVIDNFQKLLNGAIDLINSLFSGWNKVASVVPNLKTIELLKHVDLSAYKIPMLAEGAVLPANKPFLSIVGDQKNGTNIEAPAELIKQMAKEAIAEMGFNGQAQREEHYYIGETEIMSFIYRLVKGGERLEGQSLVTGGAY